MGRIIPSPLGVAMTIVSASLGNAADLPRGNAVPADYLRVCDFTDPGFFYIPGTDTCLRLGGFVRSEYAFINTSRLLFPVPSAIPGGASTIVPGTNRAATGFFAAGRIALDTRTQTAYGTLRAFIRYDIWRLQGLYSGGGPAGGADSFANQFGNFAALNNGFIQFAGITAGRVQSFYDFYADYYNYEGIANSDSLTNLFAYTYDAAGGVSATLSLEDRNARNLLAQNLGSLLGGPFAVAGSTRYGGERVPDVVGVLRTDQTWGAAQLSAAYHGIDAVQLPSTSTSGADTVGASTDGFAVQGGVRFKLPMLAAGDDLWLQGAYQQGAYSYMDAAFYFNGGFNSQAVGGFQHIDRDAVAVRLPGMPAGSYRLDKGQGYAVMAAFNHYFSPQFHDVLFGSHKEVTYGSRVKNTDWTSGGIGDASQYRVGNQFLWDPVKNLEFGLEFDYIHIDQTLAHDVGKVATALPAGIEKDPTAYEVRFRVERDF